jgi:hypothetical protein
MRRAFGVLAALVLLSACGGDDDKPATTTTTATTVAPPPTSVNTLPPTTVTTIPTTTTTNPATNGGETPQKAAEGLYNAWIANSRPGAASWADPPAVDTLLRTSYANAVGNEIEFMGCNNNPGFGNAMACSYKYEGGSMHFIMSNAIGKWRVSRVEYVAD